MQLYKLNINYQQISELIDNSDELDEEVLVDTWESIDEAFDDKVISTAYLIKNQESDIDGLSREIKRLTARKKAKTNARNRLKQYVMENMLSLDKTKIANDLFTISVRNNAESVVIKDETKLPKELMNITYVPNKTEIKEQLKRGDEVAGAELHRSQSLSIK